MAPEDEYLKLKVSERQKLTKGSEEALILKLSRLASGSVAKICKQLF